MGTQIAIIGAGPGGLAAGVLLAGAGLDVTVYESQATVGGRTSRIELRSARGTYAFDRGPTFFLMPHVLDEIFRSVGRRMEDEVDLERLDPMYRLVIGQPGAPDITIDTTQDLDAMAARLSEIHPDDGRNFKAFVEHNRKKLDASEPILRRAIRSPLDLVRPDAARALPLIKPHLSVQDLNSKYFKHQASKLAVGFQSKYLGMSPYDCPSLFTILPFIEYEYGIWHPKGGCNALMEALSRVFQEVGGHIETGSPVERLELDGRRVTGLRLGGSHAGEVRRCDHAVINADATWAMKNLIPEHLRGRHTDAQIDDRKYSCSTYMLYLGIEGEVDLPHHTIRTAPQYERNLEDIGRNNGSAGTLTEDPSFYICNPSRTDPSLAPEGDAALYILLPTPNGKAPVDWSREAPRVRANLLARVRDVLGIDLEPRIRAELQITPDDWRSMNITHGATFNLAHSLDQMLHKRPQHKLPYVDGAWLVGGGTHPGSGLPVIFLSSQITSRLIMDELGVGTIVRNRDLAGASS